MQKKAFFLFLILLVSLCLSCCAENAPAFSETFEGGLLTTLPWSDTGTLEKNKGYEVVFSVFCYMDTVLHLTNGESANPAEMEAFQQIMKTAVGKSYINTGRTENAMMVIFTDTLQSVIFSYTPAGNRISYQRVAGFPDIGAWEDKLQILSQEFLYALNALSQPMTDPAAPKNQ